MLSTTTRTHMAAPTGLYSPKFISLSPESHHKQHQHSIYRTHCDAWSDIFQTKYETKTKRPTYLVTITCFFRYIIQLHPTTAEQCHDVLLVPSQGLNFASLAS